MSCQTRYIGTCLYTSAAHGSKVCVGNTGDNRIIFLTCTETTAIKQFSDRSVKSILYSIHVYVNIKIPERKKISLKIDLSCLCFTLVFVTHN